LKKASPWAIFRGNTVAIIYFKELFLKVYKPMIYSHLFPILSDLPIAEQITTIERGRDMNTNTNIFF
jgi:hypothetical protein